MALGDSGEPVASTSLIDAVEKETGVSRSTVRTALKRLVGSGLITNYRRTYTLTEAGEAEYKKLTTQESEQGDKVEQALIDALESARPHLPVEVYGSLMEAVSNYKERMKALEEMREIARDAFTNILRVP